MNRRTFIQSGTAASLGLGITACSNAPETAQAQAPTPANSGLHPALAALKPMTAGVQPITKEERAGRIQKAQRLMAETAKLGEGEMGWELSLTLKAFITSTETATVKS